MKNQTLKLTLTLAAFCAVCALMLAGVNAITKPIIEQNTINDINNAMKIVAPEGTDFVKLDQTPSVAAVSQIYRVKNGETEIGWCILASSDGFGGAISMIVGVSEDFKVTGVQIITMSETPGLGAKAADPVWLLQFENADSTNLKVVKNATKKVGNIEAISGATITSKAVANGVLAALECAKGLK